MPSPTAIVGDAYDQVAQLYNELFSGQLDEISLDRALLDLFVHDVRRLPPGPVVDIGCGPGHVTNYLAAAGLDAEGVDVSSAMIEIARARFPHLRFEQGDMTQLAFEDGSVAAIVARYSTIHTPPDKLGPVFGEFARVLRPGGQLLMSFYGTDKAAEHGDSFDHRVVPAYRCDLDMISSMFDSAGLVEQCRHIRQPGPGERPFPQSTIVAHR